jgi:hypothetical protein
MDFVSFIQNNIGVFVIYTFVVMILWGLLFKASSNINNDTVDNWSTESKEELITENSDVTEDEEIEFANFKEFREYVITKLEVGGTGYFEDEVLFYHIVKLWGGYIITIEDTDYNETSTEFVTNANF